MTTIQPKPPPPLSLPPSTSYITLQALNTTAQLYVKSANFLSPLIPGHEIYNCPTLAFLLTHKSSNRKILFDAGVRKDYWNYSPLITNHFATSVNVKGLRVEKGVDEVLLDAGVALQEVEAVVWSHWHFDHVGDLSRFPTSTKIVVGPGFKENLLPGYPANPESPLLESDYAGKEMEEISFEGEGELRIGMFRAYDFFGDGSFYLLDVPGHAIGHMCGLARTAENSFVLLGADACHFAGALRPSQYLPMPETLDGRWGLDPYFMNPCPWELFGDCHPGTGEEKRTSPYYTASMALGSAYVEPEMANKSIQGLKEFDASDNVLICLAHDPGLFEVLPLLNDGPRNEINGWKESGYKEMLRLRFLNELPKEGKPGREPIVLGFWRDGKEVSATEALAK
ncbi:Metallo-hydrolase/oxidoreductase [Hyaloscypha variabilis]|uniref:Metallo-hydrolase/oxidoreductase n=1 Tax=Hyaloscypha variabilis (strain UAMH 11265 / GT02V1 / F) TaxID=1149755 RepID=A0A2J6RHM1_HYAVF|nr:Metallo-hydrolase/oxidoreductase [Hyaloscypha variabilis F]